MLLFYRGKITKASKDSKQLWKIIKEVTGRKRNKYIILYEIHDKTGYLPVIHLIYFLKMWVLLKKY